MSPKGSEKMENFKKLIEDTGETYSFDGETAVKGFGLLFEVIKGFGLNPLVTSELREGLMRLFNIEIINVPDLDNNRFIFTPNHVSDFDAVVLGLIIPKVRIVAKKEWAENEKLRKFMDLHYDLYGLDRSSLQSLHILLKDAVEYFEDKTDKHFLVFSQGTISDFNNNSLERISTIAHKVSLNADVPVVNIFIEQVSLNHPTRIVFDEPIKLSRKNNFRSIWLERELVLQNSIDSARRPKLTHKHSNNNKPGDLFF